MMGLQKTPAFKSHPRAVLFDFDGVIAETMNDNFSAWQKTFLDYGVKIKETDYFPLEGYPTEKIAEIILKKYGKNRFNPQAVADLKHQYYLRNNKFKIYSGVDKILSYLRRKKILMGLVTGADRRRLNFSIPKILDKFEIVIAGDDKIKGKPEPDCYLLAAKKLKISPKKCLVLENAPLGIESAKAAGCYCLALETTMMKKELSGADEVLKSHKELFKRLKIIFND